MRRSRLGGRRHLFGLLAGLFDWSDHVESLLGQIVVLAFDDFLKSTNRVFDLHVFSRQAGELLRDEHRLRKELFDFARTSHRQLVVVGKFFDTENRDDVLQFLVALQHALHRTRYVVMFLADDARIQNAREAGQGIDRGINSTFDDLAAQVGGGVQVRESRRRRRVGVVVGRHIDGLHRCNRSILGRSNAFLQFADFRVQVGLVTYGGRHAAKQGRHFRPSLYETENVVDEKQHVQLLFIAEIFRHSDTRQTNAKTRAGRLSHLPVNQGATRFVRVTGDDHARFLHFQPKVVSFAGTFTDARENRNAAMLHRDVVNQFLNQHGLAHAGAAEQSDFAALQIRLGEVHDLDTGLEHLQVGGLIFKLWGGAMNGIVFVSLDWTELVDRLAEHVHHATQHAAANRNGDCFAEVNRFHSADQTFGRLHRDATHPAFTQVARYFRDDVQRLWIIEAFAGDAHRVVNQRQVPFFKLDVYDRPDNFDHPSGFQIARCHDCS